MNPCATSVMALRPTAGAPFTLSEPFNAKNAAHADPVGADTVLKSTLPLSASLELRLRYLPHASTHFPKPPPPSASKSPPMKDSHSAQFWCIPSPLE